MLQIEKHQLDKRILAVYANRNVYVGNGEEFYNFTGNSVLFTHEKSVRHISGNEKYVGSASYDGTAAIYDIEKGKIIETIEGPDTELKCIAIHNDYIVLSTRGKTVWILNEFEISKILEDHTQDVKGCKMHESRLYTWSYDNTVKIYELFDDDHSWEMVQTIDLKSIIWDLVFYNGEMCVVTQDGELVTMEMRRGEWREKRRKQLSFYPIVCMCVVDSLLAVVVNRNCLILLDGDYKITQEIILSPESNETGFNNEKDIKNMKDKENLQYTNGKHEVIFNNAHCALVYDITCCSYCNETRLLACGSENGILYLIKMPNEKNS